MTGTWLFEVLDPDTHKLVDYGYATSKHGAQTKAGIQYRKYLKGEL